MLVSGNLFEFRSFLLIFFVARKLAPLPPLLQTSLLQIRPNYSKKSLGFSLPLSLHLVLHLNQMP
jgi:hypothetical protein